MAREKTEPGHEVKRLPLRNENGRLAAAPGIASACCRGCRA